MCSELKSLGHVVEIALAGDDKSNVWSDGYIKIKIIPIKFLRIISFWINGIISFLISFIHFKPDLVILDVYTVWFSLPLLFKRRCLIIVDNRTPFHNLTSEKKTMRDILMLQYTKLVYAYTRLFLDGMTVITEYYKNCVCEEYGFDRNCIGVWGSGVNTTKFKPVEWPIIREQFRGHFVLFQHGEISYNRGVFEVLRAINLTKKKDIILVLMGDSVKSNAMNDIRALAKELGLTEQLIILPPVQHNEVPRYIAQADCAVMTYPNIKYWNNNNPIKLLEYLSMGKVVMCTDMWTFRDIIQSNSCGVFVKNNSPQEIAEAISYCYENRDRLVAMGKSGIGIIEKAFTWKHQAENILEFANYIRAVKGSID